ncbi:hypothetical protein [Novosphingobium sp.]|uniref:hypothetical protein n=1 Tax=Novosphingobium sp. TaxID=1874826 RepID=UPI0026010B7E|nr:hypothetical protein [Novosphingobium sp.]
MHNGRNRIANSKRAGVAPRAKSPRTHRKPPPGQSETAPRAERLNGAAPTARSSSVVCATLRTFPLDAVIPARLDGAVARTHAPGGGCLVVLARRENLLAEPKRFAARPALAERTLSRASAAKPVEIESPVDAATPSPAALPLPNAPEPLVMLPTPDPEATRDRALETVHAPNQPLPRNRALVAPATGLVGKLVAWFSGSARRLWHGTPSTVRPRVGAPPDPLSVVLLRAELRELRAELAIARRVAARCEVVAGTRPREDAH